MGNNTPQVRFEGFTDAWVQRALGEIVDFYSGLTYSPENVVESGGTFVLRSSNVSGGEIINADNVYVDSDVVNCDNVNIGDVIVVVRNGSRSLIGKHAQIKSEIVNTVIGAFMTGLRSNQANFVNALLDTSQFNIEITKNLGATINQITTGAFKKMIFYVSEMDNEQIAIGTFFRTLDNCIAINQRKYDGLKKLKAAYLQQMFPQAGERVPRVRFEGFTGEWKEVALGEITERVTRKNTNLESSLPLTISAQHGLIDQTEFFDKQVASRDVSGYFLVMNGEFAYNKSYSNGYPWGAVKRLDRYDMGVLSVLYIVFKPTAIESNFLVQYYETDKWHTEIIKYAAEGARNHGLLNISPTDFFKTILVVPKNTEEQIAIGDFFRNLDTQITTQADKTEQLKRLKTAHLQKMFV